MRLRPCIDIHNGQVKQIVGGSLTDQGVGETNFVASEGGRFYGELYRDLNLPGSESPWRTYHTAESGRNGGL